MSTGGNRNNSHAEERRIDWAALNLNGQQDSAFQDVKNMSFVAVIEGISRHLCRMHGLAEFKRSYGQKSRETLLFSISLAVSNY